MKPHNFPARAALRRERALSRLLARHGTTTWPAHALKEKRAIEKKRPPIEPRGLRSKKNRRSLARAS